RPKTNGTAINLGGADASGTLGLLDAELDRITAGAINIGDVNSGTITISNVIDRAAATNLSLTTGTGKNIDFTGTGSLNSLGGNVTLVTNASGSGAITSGTATPDVSGANLSLTAGSGGIGASGNALVLSGTALFTTTGGNANQFLSAIGSTTVGFLGMSAGTGTIEFDV